MVSVSSLHTVSESCRELAEVRVTSFRRGENYFCFSRGRG